MSKRDLALRARKDALALNSLLCQEPAAMRREARLVLQSLTMQLLTLWSVAESEVERLEGLLLNSGQLLPEDSGKALMEASMESLLEWLTPEYQRIHGMLRKKGGPSSIH